MHSLAENHAALMDDVYRGQRFIYDATRKYYLLGRDRLIRELDVPAGGTVLEIGCGTGRNLVKMARCYRDARLFGLDISAEMLKTASANLRSARYIGRAELARGDAAEFDAMHLFGRARFDRIVFSYTLSMIPDWQGALRQACTLLATQGSIHIVDFGDQAGLPDWFRQGLLAWLRKFHVEPRLLIGDYAKIIADERKRAVAVHELYRGYARHIVIN
jgi:S-adenosylmethionine-diacylgycerolhomoserine-N-methlytransferase